MSNINARIIAKSMTKEKYTSLNFKCSLEFGHSGNFKGFILIIN